jgi:putative transposase
MKQEGLIVATPRRRRYGSYLGEISPAPENLINRDFQAAAPNEKWLTDITEFQIPAGKVYLSPMIDCFDGLVISWTIGTRPDAVLVNTMLDAAIETVAKSNDRPVVHSDRGAHYRWPGWLSRISNAKLIRSMSRKGCSPDNAACEGFFGRLKTELVYPRDWRETTIEQFIEVVHTYIHWYNEKRIKISLGSLSPLEYRASLGLTAQTSPRFPPHPQVPTFNWPTIGGGYPAPSNGLKVIALGHRKSAGWVNTGGGSGMTLIRHSSEGGNPCLP